MDSVFEVAAWIRRELNQNRTEHVDRTDPEMCSMADLVVRRYCIESQAGHILRGYAISSTVWVNLQGAKMCVYGGSLASLSASKIVSRSFDLPSCRPRSL
jgi:hypothetical protein